jgi:aminomethyltransferase
VYRNSRQVGKATSTTWSPLLKKMIALASVDTRYSRPGMTLQMEITIEARRRTVAAKVVQLPFFNPGRKTNTPV